MKCEPHTTRAVRLLVCDHCLKEWDFKFQGLVAARETYPAHMREGALPTQNNLVSFEGKIKCVNEKSVLFLLSC